MAREKYLLAGAVKRLMQRQLSMAWEKWQAEAAQMKHEVETIVETFIASSSPVHIYVPPRTPALPRHPLPLPPSPRPQAMLLWPS